MQADAVALRLAGALHYLVLTDAAPALAEAYRDPPECDARLWEVIEASLQEHEATVLAMLDSAPQTNEVARSAILIAAAHWLTARYELPVVLSELGASAGLNLLWDHYALVAGAKRFGPTNAVLTLAPEWRGPLPPSGRPVIHARAGVDLNPLDPITDRQRMLAYIWADQYQRQERCSIALDLAARLRPEISQGSAIDWLEQRLNKPQKHSLHLIYHTVVWQYLSPTDQARGKALLTRAGARADSTAPLAHLAMEGDGKAPGAGLRLHLWPDDLAIDLGRADYHGRWVDWHVPAA